MSDTKIKIKVHIIIIVKSIHSSLRLESKINLLLITNVKLGI